MNEKYKKNFLLAGELAGQVRAYGKSLIKTGASYNAIFEKINRKITELGGYPAFPPQIALNQVAAHYLPRPGEDIILEDQVVKLDVGVCYQGAIGDCAVTVDLSGNFQGLIDAAESALLAAEKSIAVGFPIRNIGKIIDETISSRGYKSVKNLSGHGLGYNKVHMPPIIPNYDNRLTNVIKPGMTFAIEPFATDGKGLIDEMGTAAIFSQTSRKKVPVNTCKALIDKIKSFNGLPFAIHDLLDCGLELNELEAKLDQLVECGAVAGYAPLVEVAQGMVAQAENSVLVDREGKVFITTRLK